MTKDAEYVAAGVAHYWVIDLEQGEILGLRLDDDAYTTVSRGPSVRLTDGSLGLRLELAELVRRR